MNLAFAYFPPDYRTDHPYVVGRHVGTESFFRAYLRHARPDPVFCYASAPANPLRPDPFWLYQDVPTAALALNDRVGVVANPPGVGWLNSCRIP
jgi:hypothetical protein